MNYLTYIRLQKALLLEPFEQSLERMKLIKGLFYVYRMLNKLDYSIQLLCLMIPSMFNRINKYGLS